MNWDYETKLKEYIAQAVRDTSIANDYTFEVCEEQIFVKLSTLDPNKVYVVIKYLTPTNTLGATTQPVQLLIMCEQNQIQVSQIVFNKLCDSHNFEVVMDATTGIYVKQDYRQPVVLSNFNEVSYGYRTLMYVSLTLFIMDNVMDVLDFNIVIEEEEIDEDVKPINFNIAYSMTPNTQPIPPSLIATSVKSVSTFSITFNVPMLSKYKFIKVIGDIMAGEVTGNKTFLVSFTLGNNKMNEEDKIIFEEIPMKMVSCQVVTAIDQVPSLQIGMIR